MALTTYKISSNGKGSIPSDRIAPMMTRHARFSFIFQFTTGATVGTAPANVWRPQTLTRSIFQTGDGDTGTAPFTSAGYITPALSPTNSFQMTNAYRGGAWSDSDDALLLSFGAYVDNFRVIPAADITTDTTAAVRVNSGGMGVEAAQLDDFVNSALSLAEVYIVPPGTNTSCSACIGELRQNAPGVGVMSNSPAFAGVGLKDRDSREGLHTEVLVEGNANNQLNVSPNKLLINFAGQLGDGATPGVAPWVQPLAGMALRADTSLAVIDFVMVIFFAYVTYDADGGFHGSTPTDERLCNYFKAPDSCFAT